MQAGPHDDVEMPTTGGTEPREIVEGRLHIDVVPARHQQDRDVGHGVVEALQPEARPFPFRAEGAGAPLVEQIGLVFRHPAHRRAPLAPRHHAEPGMQILRRETGGDDGVGERVRAFLRPVIGPGRLLQFKGAALADTAREGVREAAGIEDHAGETGGGQRGQRRLGMGGIGQAHRADPAIAPGLPDDPGAGIVAVLGIGDVFDEFAFRAIATAAILIDHRVAGVDEMRGDVGASHRLGFAAANLGARALRLAIGRALHHDRERTGKRLPILRRQIDIRGQPNAVAHRHHDVLQRDDVMAAFRGRGRAHGLHRLRAHFASPARAAVVSSAMLASKVMLAFEAQAIFCQ